MDSRRFEQLLGVCCAPTLTGLRAASLVSFRKAEIRDIDALLEEYAGCFQCKGISVRLMADTPQSRLVLFYRPAALARLLDVPAAQQLLSEFGYHLEDTLAGKLDYLQQRLAQSQEFPHEVGLFLGYPPADVRGFIEHQGRDFLCCGYWKVYSNEETARALFQCYTHCTRRFCRNLEYGVPIQDLLQAV